MYSRKSRETGKYPKQTVFETETLELSQIGLEPASHDNQLLVWVSRQLYTTVNWAVINTSKHTPSSASPDQSRLFGLSPRHSASCTSSSAVCRNWGRSDGWLEREGPADTHTRRSAQSETGEETG